ncbi:protein of unknown function [Methylorubrum extorquens]|uniref:Histidine kinase/HSP90-like ATPase domain-containing protein n=1 Tax=Methylorubrum extorquens TaxID=408 RepID=A0A2N9ANX2_METEX|nr:protein of unknown function [Methylorubrum extorquens]
MPCRRRGARSRDRGRRADGPRRSARRCARHRGGRRRHARESLRGALARLELPDFAGIGLGDGIRGLVSDWRARLRTGPNLHLDMEGDWSGLSGEASASLYRITQELLTNALRHGRPSRVFLRLQRAGTGGGTVTLTVDDDGGGDAARAASASGRGLPGIRARLAALGGQLSLSPGTAAASAPASPFRFTGEADDDEHPPRR